MNFIYYLWLLGIYSGYNGYASPYVGAPALAHAAYAPAAYAPAAYAPAAYGHAIAPAYARPALLAPRPVAAAVPGALLGKFFTISLHNSQTFYHQMHKDEVVRIENHFKQGKSIPLWLCLSQILNSTAFMMEYISSLHFFFKLFDKTIIHPILM